MSTSQRPFFLTIIVAGATGVGKTSLINQYAQKKFSLQYRPTDCTDYVNKQFLLDDVPVTLSIWDTLGLQRFRALNVAFYTRFDCCMVVYDVNARKSFAALDAWYAKFVSQICPPGAPKIPIILIGNKVDVDGGRNRAISTAKAKEWCALRGNIPYFETSANDDYNINEAFRCAAELALKHHIDPQMQGPCLRISVIHLSDITNLKARDTPALLQDSHVTGDEWHRCLLTKNPTQGPLPRKVIKRPAILIHIYDRYVPVSAVTSFDLLIDTDPFSLLKCMCCGFLEMPLSSFIVRFNLDERTLSCQRKKF